MTFLTCTNTRLAVVHISSDQHDEQRDAKERDGMYACQGHTINNRSFIFFFLLELKYWLQE
jgi:hypothetical protein